MGSDSYTYDANGNQITRNVGGSAFTLSYDVENRTQNVQVTRLVGVSGAVTATFVYDGDGNRVKGTVAGATKAYIGNYIEWVSGATYPVVKYYYAGSVRVAMRECKTDGTSCLAIKYLLGDHSLVPRDRLGSNAITTNSSGVKNSEIRYMPWGTTRYTSGSNPTTFQFTGQRIETTIGLYYYGARWSARRTPATR